MSAAFNEPAVYPAIHHVGIVVEEPFAALVTLEAVLAGVEIVAPLHDGRASHTGKYRTMRVSIRVGSRAELDALDRNLRAVAGVKLLL
jgi:putative lipoic acid-binding regulatory protein